MLKSITFFGPLHFSLYITRTYSSKILSRSQLLSLKSVINSPSSLSLGSSRPFLDYYRAISINESRQFSSAFVTDKSKNIEKKHYIDLSGIFPPIATPFNEDESIAYDKLEDNFQKWNRISFRGYVVQGTGGEYVSQDWKERAEMVKVCKSLANSDKLIIAGTGCESTYDTIKLTELMADAGAHVALVVNPFFYKANLTSETLYRHFLMVADRSPLPIVVYNVPANTGLDLDADLIIRLSSHPNIIGMKDSGGDITKITTIINGTKAQLGFQVLAGSAGFLYPTLSVGGVGGICALANILGEEVCRVQKLSRDGNHSEAVQLQHRLVQPNTFVTRKFGVPGMKLAMDWFGYYGGPCRKPLLALEKHQLELMRQAFEINGFSIK